METLELVVEYATLFLQLLLMLQMVCHLQLHVLCLSGAHDVRIEAMWLSFHHVWIGTFAKAGAARFLGQLLFRADLGEDYVCDAGGDLGRFTFRHRISRQVLALMISGRARASRHTELCCANAPISSISHVISVIS